MTFVDAMGFAIPLSYLVLLGCEALWPAREYPAYSLWRLKGFFFMVGMGVVATALPLLLPQEWLVQHRLIDGTSLGIVGGALVGYLFVSLVSYAWHRAAHSFGVLWRSFHQMHHAPARLDMSGAALFHPLEICVFILLSTMVTTLGLGLSPEAAALTGFIAQFYSFFQHLNMRTPRWLGYVIQRPEAHFVHHAREIHAYNFGDLPVWDILLGTFRNPADFGAGEVGFGSPNDRRLGAMLLLKDVSDQIGTQEMRAGREPARVVT